jgi:bud site selection protein 20
MVRYKPQRVTKRLRTKRKKKDLDQIWEEIHNPHQNSQLKKILRKKKVKMDLPGFGKFYCAVCDRYFVSARAKEDHEAQKPHKKRVKQLRAKPYGDFASQGIRVDNGKKTLNNSSQP